MSFYGRLNGAWASSESNLCVGLDPDVNKLPGTFATRPNGVAEFCKAIIDATADLVCAFKPQIAYFASLGAENQLEQVCDYIRSTYPQVVLILDAKRGDIGPTAANYAIEAFTRYHADAVTVNPYLGTDSVAPYFEAGGAVIGLCRTSNPGGDELQMLESDGEPMYVHVARMIRDKWSALGECGLVVGATYPAELQRVRNIVGDLPILVPGVGAQGGSAAEVLAAGSTSNGHGIIVNSSRAVLYASHDDDFAEAARSVAQTTRDECRLTL